MGRSRMKFGVLEVLGYLLGGLLLLLAAGNASAGEPMYQVVGLAAGGFIFILGSITFLGNRRILPVGVTREADSVVCRYLPWYELNAYMMFVVLPIIGISALVAGSVPGRPAWLRIAGFIMLGAVLLAGYFAVQMWRRCLVTFSRSSITVRLPARGAQLTEIPRSRIQSITDAAAEVGAAFAPVTVTQVAITYRPAEQSRETATVLIGPPAGKTALQVSVRPTDVYNALVAWEGADPDDPHLLDRVEALLRGKLPSSR